MNSFFSTIVKFFYPLCVFIIFFIFADLIFSNFIHQEKNKVRYDCFEYKYYTYKEASYSDYYLAKNCIATEKQRTVIPYKVYTDEYGYRYSKKQRSEDKKNIVFLGDSFTYGYGVKYSDSFPGIVETKLDKFNIFNLGVPGFGMHKYLYVLKNFLNDNKVHKIFITMDMTDVADAAGRWTLIPNVESPVVKSKKVNEEINNWKKIKNSNFKGARMISFHVRNFLRFLKIKFRSKKSSLNDAALKSDIANFTYFDLNDHPNYSEKIFNQSLDNINKYFKKINNLAKNNNAEVYLVIFPWPETLIYGQKKFNWENFSNDLCVKNGCNRVINLFNDFQKIQNMNDNWKDLIYIKDDVHLKKFGNQIIANKIIKTLN